MSIATPSFRLPEEILNKVQERADKEGRKKANMIAYLISQALALAIPNELYLELQEKASKKKCSVGDLVLFYLRKGLKE